MKKGDFVKVSFTGRADGMVIDTTEEDVAKKEGVYDSKREYKPIAVVVGEGMILPGMDKALEDLTVGKSKKVKLKPAEAFGERDPKMVQLVPIREFKKQNINPVPGMVMNIEGRPAKIQAVSGGRVRVDFNHLLAGKEVDYDIKVVGEAKTDKEKVTYLAEKNFRQDVPAKAEGTGAKKKLVVEIPEKLRSERALVAMKAGFFADASKILGFNEVDFVESWVKK